MKIEIEKKQAVRNRAACLHATRYHGLRSLGNRRAVVFKGFFGVCLLSRLA